MKTFFECWAQVAAGLLPQALAGGPELRQSPPKPQAEGAFGFAATLSGGCEGRFAVMLDGGLLEAPLLGEGVDQRAAWHELVHETFEAAAGEMLAGAGVACRVEKFEECVEEGGASAAFELQAGERIWTLWVFNAVQENEARQPDTPAAANRREEAATQTGPPLAPGLALLLDVELEAALRFGSREMQLGQILDLGPGDVVQLDRHVSDPVDLIVADKIVARGEVVLVNGNFGLRVTEVAEPRKRLESIRCLF